MKLLGNTLQKMTARKHCLFKKEKKERCGDVKRPFFFRYPPLKVL